MTIISRVRILWLEWRCLVRKYRERALIWLVWRLPREVVMWSYIRVGAHATTGKYGDTEVPKLSMMDALKRWDDHPARQQR